MASSGAGGSGNGKTSGAPARVLQFTVLMERGSSQLVELLHRFEQRGIELLGLFVSETPECMLIRLVLSDPDVGREILERAGLAILETRLLAVELLSERQSVVGLCRSLLQAGVKVVHLFPLRTRPGGNTVVGIMVENWEAGLTALNSRGYRILAEGELANGWRRGASDS
jgi:hypothetical protein